MKIYLDTCALHRPLDSRSQIRITLEAEAIMGIIALCEAGEVELISSEVLHFEVKRNPRPERKAYALAVLAKANAFIRLDEGIEQRARTLQSWGLKPLDALHLAAAEAGKADYFCTADDKLLKRGKAITDLQTVIVTPIELIEEINQ
jgi:predicted nucleic acid-binding protein